jgi:hypothetical protein
MKITLRDQTTPIFQDITTQINDFMVRNKNISSNEMITELLFILMNSYTASIILELNSKYTLPIIEKVVKEDIIPQTIKGIESSFVHFIEKLKQEKKNA